MFNKHVRFYFQGYKIILESNAAGLLLMIDVLFYGEWDRAAVSN